MKIVLQLFILFTIPALALSCNRHTASQSVQTDQSEAAEIVLDEPRIVPKNYLIKDSKSLKKESIM